MKFGEQILGKSVPQWRHNNIDYQKLKTVIKFSTTLSSNPENDEINLIRCSNLFLEQFNSVNLFTNLKVKEISSRIISIEHLIVKYSQMLANPLLDYFNPEESKRQMKSIANSTNRCNKELKMLSRYLIIQRIAVRKLFKKFIKYYPKGSTVAEQYIETLRNSEQLTEGYEGISFMVISLDPYLLEISLILDVLSELNVKTVQNLELIQSSLVAPNSRNILDRSTSKDINSTIKFDAIFWGKSTEINRFLLSPENTEELKFVLLSSGFQIIDDVILSNSKEIVDNSEHILNLTNDGSVRSVRSFKELRDISSFSSLVGNTKSKINRDNSISLTSNLTMSLLAPEDHTSSSNYVRKLLSKDSYNQHPSFLVHSDLGIKCILMCHVGGLRDHITTDVLPLEFVHRIIDSQESIEIHNLTPLNKLIVEWIQSRNLKTVNDKITLKRTRFISYAKEDIYLITLDEDISINETNKLPHSIFEIRRIAKDKNDSASSCSTVESAEESSKILSSFYRSLIENKIQCFPVQSYSTLWNLCYELQSSKNIQHELFAYVLKEEYALDENNTLTANEFFELGRDKVVEFCSKKFQQKYKANEEYHDDRIEKHMIKVKESLQSINDGNGTKDGTESETEGRGRSRTTISTKPERKKESIRYWNEFDDEESNLRNSTFYVDSYGSIDSESSGGRDNGFIKLDRGFINYMFAATQTLRKLLHLSHIDPAISRSRYNSIVAEDDLVTEQGNPNNENNYEDIQQLLQFQEQDMNDSDSVYEFRHDEIISFMYLSSLVASCLTSGICLLIILVIFRVEKENTRVENITLLISVIIVSLIISLLLICSSLLLLFSRYTYAPLWHYISCFVFFIMVTCTVCYGIIEIFT